MAWHCQESLSLSFNDRSLWELSGTSVILPCAEERESTGKCTCGYCAVFVEMDNWLNAYYLCTPSWMHASRKRGSTIRSCLAVILLKCAFIMATLLGCCACTLLIIGWLTNGRVHLGHVCHIANPGNFWAFRSRVLSLLRWHTGSTFLDHFPAHLVPLPAKVNCTLWSGKVVVRGASETAGNFFRPRASQRVKGRIHRQKGNEQENHRIKLFPSFRLSRLVLHGWTSGGCRPEVMPHNSHIASDHPAHLPSHGGMHDGMCPAVLDSSGEVLCFFRGASGDCHTDRVI